MDLLSRPRLGVALWTLGNLPLAESAKIVAEMQYDGVVLPFALVQKPEEVLRILGDQKLTCFALSANDVDLAHPKSKVRQQAVDHVKQAVETAVALQVPLITVRERVGRVRPIRSEQEERQHFETAVAELADFAQERQIDLAVNVVNRYEGYLLTKTAVALEMVERVGKDNLKLTLSAFHMNMEEQDAGAAIQAAGDNLGLYYLADSNRQAIGEGHLKLGLHLWALESLPQVPVVLECLPTGGDPFGWNVSEINAKETVRSLKASRIWF